MHDTKEYAFKTKEAAENFMAQTLKNKTPDMDLYVKGPFYMDPKALSKNATNVDPWWQVSVEYFY